MIFRFDYGPDVKSNKILSDIASKLPIGFSWERQESTTPYDCWFAYSGKRSAWSVIRVLSVVDLRDLYTNITRRGITVTPFSDLSTS